MVLRAVSEGYDQRDFFCQLGVTYGIREQLGVYFIFRSTGV